MSWMLTWRLAIFAFVIFHGLRVDIIVPVAVVTSAAAVFLFNKTLVTWPLRKLAQRKPILVPADSWGGERAPEKQPYIAPKPHGGTATTPRYGTQPTPLKYTEPRLTSASQAGRITGFEPGTISERPVPSAFNMTGAPGSGLKAAEDSDYGGSMSEQAVSLGKMGEENFARALQASGLLHRFPTSWSLPVPDPEIFRPAAYDADIDCALATGRAIFLIDLKNYKSGNVRYYAEGDLLICEDVPTGKIVGKVRHMTINMQTATNVIRSHFPEVNVVPVVVFMPTDKGEGIIDDVKWPGGIRAMNLTTFIAELADEPDFAWDAPHAGAYARLSNLLLKRDQGR